MRKLIKTNKYSVAPKADRSAYGVTFHSKKEMGHYTNLRLLQRMGHVRYFLMQVPLRLKGGTVYRVDFQVFWPDGSVSYQDVKGMRTKVYKVKKREVEAEYPITIEEI